MTVARTTLRLSALVRPSVLAARSLSLAETRQRKAHVTRERRAACRLFSPNCVRVEHLPSRSRHWGLDAGAPQRATLFPFVAERLHCAVGRVAEPERREEGREGGREAGRLVERTSVGWTPRLNPPITATERDQDDHRRGNNPPRRLFDRTFRLRRRRSLPK